MKHIGNNTEEAALKRSNLGYVLVLIAALMWGSIGIFVNGISVTADSEGNFMPFFVNFYYCFQPYENKERDSKKRSDYCAC